MIHRVRNINRSVVGGLFPALLICFMLLTSTTKSQQLPSTHYYFKSDTIQIKGSETFSNVLVIKNTAAKRDTLLLRVSKYMDRALLRLPDTIVMEPNSTRYLPIKFLADSRVIEENIQSFTVGISSTTSEQPMQNPISFYTVLEEIRGLILDVQASEIYLGQLDNTAELQIRAFNSSLIPLTFRMQLNEVPEGLAFTGEEAVIHLNAGEQMLLPFIAKADINTNKPLDFWVTIRAIDVLGNQLAFTKVRVMTVSSNRQLVLNTQDIYYKNRPNTLSLNYVSANNFSSLQLNGGGRYKLTGQQELAYNINFNYFTQGQYGISMYDTYVDYRRNRLGIRIGNIYESLDFNVNGRGIKASLFLGGEKRLNLYGLQNDYLLFGDKAITNQGGSTFAVEYIDGIPSNEKTRFVLLRNKETISNLITNLVSGKQALVLTKEQQLRLEGGYSIQYSGTANTTVYSGYAAGAAYRLQNDDLQLSSSQYYASPYYGGLQRGLFQSENYIGYTLSGSNTLSGRVSLMQNRARFLSKQMNAYVLMTNAYSNQTYEVGFRTNFNRHWSFELSPYYFKQVMEPNSFDGQFVRWKSSSARAKLNLSYSDDFQSISLNMDNGYTAQNTSNRPPAPFFSTRINLSYRNNTVGFNGYYQHNPYYLSDALANSETATYDVFSLGPNMHFSTWQNRLSVNASVMYYYYGYSRSQNYILNTYARLNLKKDWAITTEVFFGLNKRAQLSTYNPETGLDYETPQYRGDAASFFTSRQVKVGIEKHFGSSTDRNEKRLELLYFEDINANGIRDKGEHAVSGILVKINGVVAITNTDGKVKFTAPALTDYVPSIVNEEGWTLLQQASIFLDRNKMLEIALVKTERLHGVIQVVKKQYGAKAPVLAGIRIQALSSNGKLYQTVSNSEGLFNLYLPENEYTVFVDTKEQPFSMLEGKQVVAVKRQSKNELVFHYEDQSRKVDVQKF